MMRTVTRSTQGKFRLLTRGAVKRLGVFFFLMAVGLIWSWFAMIRMPGVSFSGALPPLSVAQAEAAGRLRERVVMLGETIGERNVFRPEALNAAADWIEGELGAMGYAVKRQEYAVNLDQEDLPRVEGLACFNLEVEIGGGSKAEEVVIVGAHYDSVLGCPGANDNGSGVAALLELGRRFAGEESARTLRLVFFANEEPPWFQTEQMGSMVYARGCAERKDTIVAMYSLETMGCFMDAAGSQRYPWPLSMFYPDKGNFIAFVGNAGSRGLVKRSVGVFREEGAFPSEGAAVPGGLPGVGWSDHWSFWKVGYPGVMVTDTAPFRFEEYHTRGDTPGKVDFERLARVVEGLEGVIRDQLRR